MRNIQCFELHHIAASLQRQQVISLPGGHSVSIEHQAKPEAFTGIHSTVGSGFHDELHADMMKRTPVSKDEQVADLFGIPGIKIPREARKALQQLNPADLLDDHHPHKRRKHIQQDDDHQKPHTDLRRPRSKK